MFKRATIQCLLLGLLSAAAFGKTTPEKINLHFRYTITGIDKVLLKNANERMRVMLQSVKPVLKRHAARQLYRAGKQEITLALQPYGYYQPTVDGKLTQEGQDYVANYTVEKGEPIRIQSLTVLIKGPGKLNPKLQKALKKIPLKQNDVLEVSNYQRSKVDLINAARTQGYINAELSQDSVKVNLIHYQANVEMVLDTGPRYYFGPVALNKTPLNPDFLRRFLNFKPGEPYNPQKLTDLQSTYAGTGYFRSISITPSPNRNTHKVPVKLKFEMNKKHLYQIGLGYGTVSGIRLSGAINWRYIGQYGHKFKLSGLWSRTYYDLSAQYLIPAHNPVSAYYTLNASMYIMQANNNAQAYVAKFGPGYLWQVQKWTFEGYLWYLNESWRLNGNDNYQSGHLIMPEVKATRLSTQNIVSVENGSRYQFVVSGAYKSLYSAASYLSSQFNFKGIKTLGVGNRFILGLQLGAIAGSQYNDIPLSQRFFAGGDNSILGFDYLGIGPGRYLTVANTAYQRKIYGDFYAQVFYDLGNAFVSFDDYKHNLNRTAGLGVVWRTPVGDLTVYWAKILSKQGQPNQFGFSLGPEL